MRSLSVKQLFDSAARDDLALSGPVDWGEPLPERGSGIYVIALLHPAAVSPEDLPENERKRWNDGQAIVYIGRGKQLRRRLRQFYKHRHGAKGPHRGGQAVKLLNCQLLVYWAAVGDYAGAENSLVEAFRKAVGRLPFANRMRSARLVPRLD